LHFAFPVTTNDKVKRHPVSNAFLEEWRQLIDQQPYGNLFDWYKMLGVDNKQGQIGVDEAAEINKALSLKAYEGGYKVMIIWAVDKMNAAASNKLLKLLEEPPAKTLFLLLTESEANIIDTIKSRCQVLHFPNLSAQQIAEALQQNYGTTLSEAKKIAHQAQGDYLKAIHLLHRDGDDIQFEKWFVTWVRTAFQAKGKKEAVLSLIEWSENIAKTGRETQKNFLEYCVFFFRQALLKNYKVNDLVFMETETGFDLSKFAPFVHNTNILPIIEALQNASYHIQRNGNSKIIITDLSIKLTRLLHKKSQ